MSGYDLIGDIHGNADGLKELLARLGYGMTDGAWRHPQGRKAIFLGDMINRGAQNKEVVEIVRAMLKAGSAEEALPGNHEYNEIRLADKKRKITAVKLKERAAFLADFPPGSPEYKDVIKWFRQRPLYIRKKEFNAVHACWHENAIDIVKPKMEKNKNTARVQAAINILLKGPAYKLPVDAVCVDHEGEPKQRVRDFYWEKPDAEIGVFLEKAAQFSAGLDKKQKSAIQRLHERFHYHADKKPLFMGHYHLPGEPRLVAPNVACLNFGRYVVGYRWNEGDTKLSADRLEYV